MQNQTKLLILFINFFFLNIFSSDNSYHLLFQNKAKKAQRFFYILPNRKIVETENQYTRLNIEVIPIVFFLIRLKSTVY